MNNYHSVEEVADRYGVGKKIIYALIRDRELHALKIGKKVFRISESELQRWEAAKREHPGEASHE